MGQPIAVTRRATDRPGFIRFETNRTLTGMGHERYASLDDVLGDRPPDVLARRLLESGDVASVHIHSNVIDVELSGTGSEDALEALIRDLYIHYREGVEPSFQG